MYDDLHTHATLATFQINIITREKRTGLRKNRRQDMLPDTTKASFGPTV